VTFVNAQEGWIAGDTGIILHTINGGEIWTMQDSDTLLPIFGISCANSEICYGVGGIPDDTLPDQVLLRTDDGGDTWAAAEDVDDALFSVFALPGTNFGWAVGDFGIILATTDGGVNWDFQ